MQNYYLIFINSLVSSIIMNLKSEYGWFSALQFGGYDMRLATFMALTGATLGTMIDYLIGYGLAFLRQRYLSFGEESFTRTAGYFRKYVVFLLLFPWVPFTSVFALMAGVFRIPPFMMITIILVGRIGYYGYYLVQS